ncbi:proteasome accessory factor PafA2 family protein, partial [Escherichia coli]|nr:proteasome accessory factor PafA2 family protein [Escherichia coli]
RDMTGKAEIPLRSGETATALQIQREFLDAATEWLKVREENMVNEDKGIAGAGTSNEEMSRIVELWGRALDAVETGDWSLIEH